MPPGCEDGDADAAGSVAAAAPNPMGDRRPWAIGLALRCSGAQVRLAQIYYTHSKGSIEPRYGPAESSDHAHR